MDSTELTTATNGAADPALDELRALNERRAKLEDAREARAALTTEEQVIVAKRALAADEALDMLEQREGKIGKAIQIVRVDDERDGRAVVLKRPNMTQFRRFVDSDKDEQSKELDRLVRPAVLYPDKVTFDALVEELPFLMSRCADACIALAGVRKKDVKAK